MRLLDGHNILSGGMILPGHALRANPPAIRVLTPPSIGPLVDGDVIEDAPLSNGTYEATTEGASIASVVATLTVNGNPAQPTDTISMDDVVGLSVLVTDDVTPTPNTRTVAVSRTVAADFSSLAGAILTEDGSGFFVTEDGEFYLQQEEAA